MDLASEELQFLSIPNILRESISIPKQSPRTFYLITLILIFPLSFAILAHSLFTHPILNQLNAHPSPDPVKTRHEWTLLLVFQFCYLLFLFVFSLLSTAAVVFTVASLYTSKPVSFSSTISAIPKVFKRLFVTFLWVSLLMLVYHAVFLVFLMMFFVGVEERSAGLVVFSLVLIAILFLVVHVYITALWHLASVVSVLESVYGFAAMRKSYELLKGKTRMGGLMVFGYLAACGVVAVVFGVVVVRGRGYYNGVFSRVLIGGLLVGVLVIVNLIGLLVQSVFYYVCKSYHHEGIDKGALHDHLGGYLGEYVPLKSNIQMEDMDA